MTILVTGGTGVIGTEVTRQLLAAGVRPRLLLRDPAKARHLEGRVDIVQADLGDAEAVQVAMRGASSLFLLTSGPDMQRLEQNAVIAAKEAGVGHIVKMSVAGAEIGSLALGRRHLAIEKSIIASGIAYTLLRPVNFMSNALQWIGSIRSQAGIFVPTGEGRVAYIDPADVAAVAVRALLGGSTHQSQAYLLTGPEAISTAEIAAVIGRAIGRTISFVDIPFEAAKQQLVQLGVPEPMIDTYREIYDVIRTGQLSFVSPTVETVLGRKPTSFAQWVERNRAAFQ